MGWVTASSQISASPNSAASGELKLALLPKSSDWEGQLESLNVVTWIQEDIHHGFRR